MDLLKVGKLGKSRGIKGEIRLILDQDFMLDKVDVVFVEEAGNKVPYFVKSFNTDGGSWVKFDSIDTPEKAKQVNGKTIYFRSEEVSFASEPEDDFFLLVGYTIYNDDVSVGEVTRIEEYPQQLMSFVMIEDQEILIPLIPEFILDIDQQHKKLMMSLPENLIESQLGD